MWGTFAGCVTFGTAISPDFAEQAQRVFAASGLASSLAYRTQRAAIIHSEAEALIPGPGGRGFFVASARLDNRDELGAALGLGKAELFRTSDAGLLARMFARWSEDGIARCLGEFCFAHHDGERLIFGRDCLGHRSLLFHRGDGVVIFSNRLGFLLALADVPRAIDDLAIAHFLAGNLWRGSRETAYRGIERTPSRSLVTIDAGSVRESCYWSPDFHAKLPYRRDEDYVERARELFDQAVACATDGAREVAITASGGLDSSAIAATVARQGRVGRIACYTTIPPADLNMGLGAGVYRDERDKVELLGRMYPQLEINFLERGRPHPFDDDQQRYFARNLLPRITATSLGMSTILIEAVAPHGRVLEGARGNFGLTWTGQLSLLAELRDLQWLRFARELPQVARHSRKTIVQTLLTDVIKPTLPARLRRLAHRRRGRDPDSVALHSGLNPAFIADHDLPRLWREQGFDPWFEMTGWSSAPWRAQRLFDRASADIDNLGWRAQTMGLEMRDPFADRRLLEFALAVPEPLYRRNGVPRSFARVVFGDRLPREITQELRRGANNLEWFRKLDERRSQFAAEIERIEASPTASRLIDISRLKRLLADWPENEDAARRRLPDYNAVFARAVHVGNFIRWVEGGNE